MSDGRSALRIIEFERGEYTDGDPWELLTDTEVSVNHVTPCRHAIRPREVEHGKKGETGHFVDKLVTVPRLLRAHNEGHCNVTMLCLDCVREAVG